MGSTTESPIPSDLTRNPDFLDLRPMQQKFVTARWGGLCPRDAARAAGYSARTVVSKSSVMEERLAHVILPGIQEIQEEVVAVACLKTREDYFREIENAAFADVRDLFDENGHPIPINKLSTQAAAQIASVDVTEKDGVTMTRYRFVPKVPALELYGKARHFLGDEDLEDREKEKLLRALGVDALFRIRDFLKAKEVNGHGGNTVPLVKQGT